MILPEIFLAILLGLMAGSFATALIYRVPQGGDWVKARSACTSCGHVLGVFDLFPVLSWVLSGGKCRYCKASVSWRYPATEGICAALCLLVYIVFGFNAEGFLAMASIPFLTALLVIDLRHMILPNPLVLALFVLGAARAAWFWIGGEDVSGYILGAIIYAALSWGLGIGVAYALKKEALGFGDVKFFMVAGLWLGVAALPYFLLLSGVSGVVFALVWRKVTGSDIFPFGPALIAAFYILLLYQGAVLM